MYIPKKRKYWKLLWVDYFIHKQIIHFQYFWKFKIFISKDHKFERFLNRLHLKWVCSWTNILFVKKQFVFYIKNNILSNKILHVFYDSLWKWTQLYPKWSKCIHILFIVLQSEVCTKRFINITSNIEINTANTYQSF